MRPGKTIVSILIFGILLGIYLADQKRMAKQRDAKEQSERLFTAEVANIERVVLDNENGHFVLERRGDKTEAKAKAEAKEKEPGEWWLVEPISARADREQVDPMLENLRGAKRRNSFAPKAGGLAAYGLEKPAVRVELDIRESGKAANKVRIAFGTPAAQNYQVYAQVEGEKDIFTLSDYSKRQCDKNLFALRDKSILAAPPEKATRLEIAIAPEKSDQSDRSNKPDKSSPSPSRILVLERSAASADSRWRLEPGGRAADTSAVEELLRTINTTRATRIVDQPTSSAAELGLTRETARAIVTVALGSSSSASSSSSPASEPRTLLIGRAEPGTTAGMFCRIEGESRLLVTRASFLADLQKEPKDLRDRAMAGFEADDIRTITIRSPRYHVVLERSKPGADWTFADPPGDAPVSQKKAAQLANNFASLRAKSFLAEGDAVSDEQSAAWGFLKPMLKIGVTTFDDPTTRGFVFGDPEGKEGTVYTQRLGDSAFLSVDFARVNDFFKVRPDLEDRTFVRFDPDKVQRMRLDLDTNAGPITLEFKRRKASWQARANDGAARTVDSFEVASFLDDIRDMEYVDLFTPDASDATRGGLEKPAVRVSLMDEDGAELGHLVIGGRQGLRQVMSAPGGSYLVSLAMTEGFTRSLETLLDRFGKAPPEQLRGTEGKGEGDKK